ncbi:hypothetical protein DYB30_014157 [Aphanomyces astaci]|nr:hypothetical protein DYB34_009000 [Aphanomyces astaci]RHY78381.1 hypothetical protein DYB30_014157 [Aphanomyces astaci]
MMQWIKAADEASSVLRHLRTHTEEMEAKMAEWAELERRIQENLANPPNIVTLDVGGTIFKTSKANLLRVEGSYFHALLGSGQWKPDSPGDA